MPVTIIQGNESCLSLSWEEKQQLLQDTKNYETRSSALSVLLQCYERRIEILCRSREWSKQWGFDDSYQEAIAYFCELAIQTEDPFELDSFWGIYSAIKNGAVRNLFPISLTPYYLKKLPANTFRGDFEEVSEIESSEEQIFDELGWIRLKRLCEETLSKRQNQLLELVFRTPGFLPTTAEIAEYFGLTYSSAERAWNYFRSAMQENQAIQKLWTELLGDSWEEPIYSLDETEAELNIVGIETPLAEVVSLEDFRTIRTQERWKRAKLTFRNLSSPGEGIAQTIQIVSALCGADHFQFSHAPIETALIPEKCIPLESQNSAQRALNQSPVELTKAIQDQNTLVAIAFKVIAIKSCRGSPTDPLLMNNLQLVS